MSPRCLALLSGGLDSILAIRIMQEQGVVVEAATFKTIFTRDFDQAHNAAMTLGVPLTELSHGDDDYLELIRHPKFESGPRKNRQAAAPCIDCRIYMLQNAKLLMSELRADFIVTGEVVGQSSTAQKKRDLKVILHHADRTASCYDHSQH